MNECLLILSVILLYGGVILACRFLGKDGLFGFSVMATILANIEVLILVDAFHMEMTLGNVMFASTFLITDVLSENYGKASATRAVVLGTAGSVMFILVSQMWILYIPSSNDWAMPAFQTIFSNTPRMVLASLLVYLITQMGDVWLYHKWWSWTTKKFGDAKKGLWIRNNGSTLISQFFNSLLYTFFAFFGMYSMGTLWSIVVSSYVIFIFTSLLDTPAVYICRRIHEKEVRKAEGIVQK